MIAASLCRLSHEKEYNKYDAVCIFVETYINIAKFEEHLDDQKIDPISKNVLSPDCMAYEIDVGEQSEKWNWSVHQKMMLSNLVLQVNMWGKFNEWEQIL